MVFELSGTNTRYDLIFVEGNLRILNMPVPLRHTYACLGFTGITCPVLGYTTRQRVVQIYLGTLAWILTTISGGMSTVGIGVNGI